MRLRAKRGIGIWIAIFMAVIADFDVACADSKNAKDESLPGNVIEIGTKTAIALGKALLSLGERNINVEEYDEILIQTKREPRSYAHKRNIYLIYFIYDKNVRIFGSSKQNPNQLVIVDDANYSVIYSGKSPP